MLKLVKRNGQKFWIARGTVNGKRIERSTKCTRKSDAEVECRRIEDEIKKLQGGEAKEVVTFARAVTYYIELGHSPRFLKPLLDYFETVSIQDIDGADLQKAARAIYPNCKAATVNRQVYTPMTAILNLAAENGWCAPPKFRRPKIEKPEMKAASAEWFEALFPELPAKLVALLALMATTGIRTTNALFAEYDLVNCSAVIGKDKRGRPIVVQYPEWVRNLIANLPDYETDSIFGYQSRWSVYSTLRRACGRAGIEYLTPHQLGRHTFATNLLKAGKSLAFVKEAGHWSSGKLVMETYGHLEQSDIRQNSAEVGEKWGKKLKMVSK